MVPKMHWMHLSLLFSVIFPSTSYLFLFHYRTWNFQMTFDINLSSINFALLATKQVEWVIIFFSILVRKRLSIYFPPVPNLRDFRLLFCIFPLPQSPSFNIFFEKKFDRNFTLQTFFYSIYCFLSCVFLPVYQILFIQYCLIP